METIKYDKKDIVPIVICVLNYMACHINACSFNIALTGKLAHLQGIVDPEFVEEEQLAQLDDPLSLVLRRFAAEVTALYYALSVLHQLELAQIFDDERIGQLANDVYWRYALYDPEATESAITDLQNFVLSLPAVVDDLKELIRREELAPMMMFNSIISSHYHATEAAEDPAILALAEFEKSLGHYHIEISAVTDAG